MQGKVKWFSTEKGYGFVVGDDGTERHFQVRDVVGTNLPRNGDVVAFGHEEGKRGPRALRVTIIGRAAEPPKDDQRVTCSHCGKKMVPRIITHRGSLSHSVCPFCGGTHKNFSSCFIATAVYGNSNAPEVVTLRRFRDNTLRSSFVGRTFIALYYALSPRVARALVRNPRVAAKVRKLLDLIVRYTGA